MGVTIVDHPLVAHRLAELRDPATGPHDFRRLANEVGTFLAYEATRDLETDEARVVTAMGVPARARRLARPRPLLVPILRAGLGLLDGVLTALPGAEVGMVGLRRDETTFRATLYCCVLPDDLSGRDAIILDPMLATGGSMAATCELLEVRRPARITALCLIAAPEGAERVLAAAPDTRILTAALDERLDENAYIVPGLGDAGDRLFGAL